MRKHGGGPGTNQMVSEFKGVLILKFISGLNFAALLVKPHQIIRLKKKLNSVKLKFLSLQIEYHRSWLLTVKFEGSRKIQECKR